MTLLETLAARWRWRWTAGVLLAAAATGVLIAVAVAPAAGAAAGLGVVGALFMRRRRVDSLLVARHLNRVVPALEESADLLCLPESHLAPLERLQRARVEQALAGLAELPALPHRAFRLALLYTAAALLVTTGLLVGAQVSGPMSRPAAPGSAAAARPAGPPRVLDVAVVVRPPAYTRKPSRRSHAWDIEAEQDALVTWRLRLDRPIAQAVLVTTDDDTIPFVADGSHYEASRVPEHSLLYQLVLRDSGPPLTSDFHRLAVVPDAPPTLTVVRPEPRTAVPFGGPSSVPLEVLAGDDYGVADARIVATVTTGEGEGVKFREQVLEFDTRAPRGHDGSHGLILRKDLKFSTLQLQPGDELYFYVLAHDTRVPRANETRSETYFVSLADTGMAVVADLTGLAVNRIPEYFRSQRQIIIDTERLLAERSRIGAQEFKDRSANIGFDQHLLRERYAELAGEETVDGGTEPTIEHEHDTEENATLLARSVKQTLQSALAQMWEAELRLRTYDPQAALPFEYRALELLKQVQQTARLYVLRVGFEPPPLEPDRTRLTGTLTAIGNPSRTHDVVTGPALPAVRAALAVIHRLESGETRPGDIAALEQAGREIAPLAIASPGLHLATLGDLRSLISSLAAGSHVCDDCLLRAERGLWRVLPNPDPGGGAAGRRAGAGVSRTYFELLRGNP